MKIIISHDVDHITFREHLNDGVAGKFCIRTMLEMASLAISPYTVFQRVKRAWKNKWNNIEDLMSFDKSYKIDSTFFIGVGNGLGLSYSRDESIKAIRLIKNNGFEVGVHGIAFDNIEGIKTEYEIFKSITNDNVIGIRTHYLRRADNSSENYQMIGYDYDAGLYGMGDPIVKGAFVTFPLTIMDGRILEMSLFGIQKTNFNEVFSHTLKIIENAEANGQQYLSILFHDRYFSNEFPFWRRWYIELIEALEKNGHTFINYRQAWEELIKENHKGII